jgi:saccharopine dehydrogenase-like NADP-dependent oxidoreductase
MKRVIVLGAGVAGSAIAVDLKNEYEVAAVDIDKNRLGFLKTQHGIETMEKDLSRAENVFDVVQGFDLAVGAVPGYLGFETLKSVLSGGVDMVDTSFFTEDPFGLKEIAREHGTMALLDCGVAPGMSNMILGFHNARMEVDLYECLVGGLPVKRSWPYQYKAPFSPMDVIEEYIRPAKVVEGGVVVTKPALSDPEYVEIDPLGTLEAFNTDGLRTLLKTMKVPYMKEKTLRYPGHIEYIRVLRDSGFFSREPIEVQGRAVCPIDVTSKLLFPKWQLDEKEPEITVMQVLIRGTEEGVRKEYTYRLFDHYDAKTHTSSMARTTGFTCSAVARLILEGAFKEKGIIPPETLGAKEECFNRIMAELKKRNVNYIVEEKRLGGSENDLSASE